jgi:hypothetical protein
MQKHFLAARVRHLRQRFAPWCYGQYRSAQSQGKTVAEVINNDGDARHRLRDICQRRHRKDANKNSDSGRDYSQWSYRLPLDQSACECMTR